MTLREMLMEIYDAIIRVERTLARLEGEKMIHQLYERPRMPRGCPKCGQPLGNLGHRCIDRRLKG